VFVVPFTSCTEIHSPGKRRKGKRGMEKRVWRRGYGGEGMERVLRGYGGEYWRR